MKLDCPNCNQVFDGPSMFDTPLCPVCRQQEAEAKAQAESERRHERLKRQWSSLCPPAFDAIERGKLPDPTVLDRVLAWRRGPLGLLLHGDTSRGKTRCSWQLLRREHFSGREVFAVDALSLADHPNRLMTDNAGASEWVKRACRCDLLLLDDPFKVALTPRVEEALYLILDHRAANGLPIIVTTNDTGETLSARLSADRCAPLIRRIREFTQDIAA